MVFFNISLPFTAYCFLETCQLPSNNQATSLKEPVNFLLSLSRFIYKGHIRHNAIKPQPT